MAIANATQSQAPPPAAALTPKLNGSEPSEPALTKTHAVGHASSFIDVPLSRLDPSKTNPRKHFDGPEMAELVESVRQKGVLMPILVRDGGWRRPFLSTKGEVALPGTEGEVIYEIVAGERRYRAAQAAGLKTIPARIAQLTDQEALEIQIIENLQRKDVTALEEADGYARLFKQMQVAQPKGGKQELVADIAKKIGKSVRYVYARMKLTELCEEVKKALAAGEIPASHADELVRLKAADQKHALKEACFRGEYIDGKDVKSAVSVRLLKARLEQYYCNLSSAPWKQDDATLLPLAGACSDCPKNTANQPDADPKEKLCVDRDCFGKKRQAFVEITLANAQKPGEPKPVMLDAKYPHEGYKGAVSHWRWSENVVKPGACKHAVTGVIVAGPETGHRRTVCLEEACKVHHSGHAQQTHSAAARVKPPSPEERKKEEESRKSKHAAQEAVFLAALDKVKDVSGAVLDVLIERAFFNADIYEENCEALAKYFGLAVNPNVFNSFEAAYKKAAKEMSGQQKARMLFALLHGEYVDDYHGDRLNDVARSLGVDPKKIREQTIAEWKAAQTSAKAAELKAAGMIQVQAKGGVKGAVAVVAKPVVKSGDPLAKRLGEIALGKPNAKTSSEQSRKPAGGGAKKKSASPPKPKAASGKKGGRK